MPNAGAPAYVDGRYVYLCTPEYIATYGLRFVEAGARLVGGCCGTTPAHIRNLARSLRMVQPGPGRGPRHPGPRSREARAASRPPGGQEPARQEARAQVRGLDRTRSAQGRRSLAGHREGPRMQGERSRRHQRGRRPPRLGPHERAVDVPSHPSSRPASTPSFTTPAATAISSASSPTSSAAMPWACATSCASPAIRPSSATIPTPPRFTTSTRSASSAS